MCHAWYMYPIIYTQYNKEIRNLRSQDIRTIDLEIGSSSFRVEIITANKCLGILAVVFFIQMWKLEFSTHLK